MNKHLFSLSRRLACLRRMCSPAADALLTRQLYRAVGGCTPCGCMPPPRHKVRHKLTVHPSATLFDPVRPCSTLVDPGRTQVYPLDAVFDTPDDVPEDIKTNKRYAASSGFTVSEARSTLPSPCPLAPPL